MASTLGTERKEARRWARDTDPSNFAVGTRAFNRVIESELHRVGSRVRLGQAWVLAAITLSTSTDPPDYTLPTTSATQYQQIIRLRRQSDKRELDPLSRDQIAWLRRGTTTPTGAFVTYYALMEDTAQTVTVMFDVKPTQADSIDLLRTVIPASLADADSAAIPFDRDLLEGFRQGCAARACHLMSAEQRQDRGITPDYVADLESVSAEAVRRAEIRVARMKLSGQNPVNLGWLPPGWVPLGWVR